MESKNIVFPGEFACLPATFFCVVAENLFKIEYRCILILRIQKMCIACALGGYLEMVL